MPKYNGRFTDLLIRFAQYRCPVSTEHPTGGSKVRGAFYDKCYLYRDRFGIEPPEDMLRVIWEQGL